MSTEAQLKALSNSELASGTQIPALKHRTVNDAIIEEMYDAQSRGNVLSGVQTATSLASGDEVFVIRSGEAYLLDADELGFVSTLADLTDVNIPAPSNDQVLAYNFGTSKWMSKDVSSLSSVVSITGTATTNQMVKFTGLSSIGNSNISDDGSTVAITGNLSVNTDDLYVNSSNNRVGVGTSTPATNFQVVGNILADFVATSGNSFTKIFSMDQDIQTTDAVEFAGVTAGSFVTSGGTSTDFVKGDGSLDGTTYQDEAEKNQANGYAPLDSGAKIPLANLPDSILGQVSYQGTWAASTNTPTLDNPPASTTKGEYYVSSDDGTQFGIEFKTGDWIISNGTAWEKVDNTDAVTSVFGRLGNVIANASDYENFYVDFNSNQSITGQKTFGSGDLRIVSGGSGNLPAIFRNTSAGVSQDAGSNTLGFNVNNDLYFTKGETIDFNGAVLSYDNTGIRTYTLPDASGTFAFTSDLTTLNASNITTGTLADARLSSNVALKDVDNDFSANQTISNGSAIASFRVNTQNAGVSASNYSQIELADNSAVRTFWRNVRDGTGSILFGFSNNLKFLHSGTTEKLLINSSGITVNGDTIINGNVGIGTTSPQSILNNFSSSARGIAIENSYPIIAFSDTASSSFKSYVGTDSGELYFWNASNGPSVFATNNTERMRIDSSGNVGIGTTSPSQKLDVDGNVTISGTTTLGQKLTVNSGNDFSLEFIRGTKEIKHVFATSGFYGIQGLSGYIISMDADNLNVNIGGSLSKGSGSFKIDHPLPKKKDTHHLVHSFVEAPQADNIYRGKIDLVDGKATVNLDEAGRMTEGTFVLLNGNIQCFTSNESGWTAIRGKVEGNILTIEAQDAKCTDTISWLVIGERIDQHMIDTSWTDENGRVITEPLKKVETTPSEEITE